MEYQMMRENNDLIIGIRGEVDLIKIDDLKTSIKQERARALVKNLILDLRQVNFIDSSGLGLILTQYKSLKEIGGKVKIINANEITYKILEMSGLCKLMEINKL